MIHVYCNFYDITGVSAGCEVRFLNFSLRGTFTGVGALYQDQKAAGRKFFIKRASRAVRLIYPASNESCHYISFNCILMQKLCLMTHK